MWSGTPRCHTKRRRRTGSKEGREDRRLGAWGTLPGLRLLQDSQEEGPPSPMDACSPWPWKLLFFPPCTLTLTGHRAWPPREDGANYHSKCIPRTLSDTDISWRFTLPQAFQVSYLFHPDNDPRGWRPKEVKYLGQDRRVSQETWCVNLDMADCKTCPLNHTPQPHPHQRGVLQVH